MKKIGIFFGSTLGHTAEMATHLWKAFGEEMADLYNIENATADDVAPYEVLIFGTSTWGVGEPQEHWETFLKKIENLDLSKKYIALFGVGDQKKWPDSFVNAMGALYFHFKDRGKVIGFTSTDGYHFDTSLAVQHNRFVGLALDPYNQPELTSHRIHQWVKQILLEIS